jgi:hypothetical protein
MSDAGVSNRLRAFTKFSTNARRSRLGNDASGPSTPPTRSYQ